MSNQPMLSLCMIVKNEEKSLPISLKSVEGIADELIIVDTGSTDKTEEVAKEHGANVYKKKWRNDFSEVRNFAIEKAKGKWILILDADESILEGDAEKIKGLLHNPINEGYLFYIHSRYGNLSSSAPTQALRLFRNRKEYRYKNRVFERIPDEKLTHVADGLVSIIHHPNQERRIQMQRLKIRMLEEEIVQSPSDPYLHYVYGIELLNAGQMAESIAPLRTALKNASLMQVFTPHLYKCLVWSLIHTRKIEDALEVIIQGIKDFPQFTDLVFFRGQCHQQARKYSEAIKDFELCLKMKPAPMSFVPDEGITTYKAYFSLGQVHEALQNHEIALEQYEKAYKNARYFDEALYSAGTLLKDHPKLGELDQVLLGWMEEGLDQMMTLIDILCLQRQYEKALFYVDQTETIHGQNEDLLFARGICLMMLEYSAEAEQVYERITREHPYYPQVLLRRIQNYWFADQWKEAGVILEEIRGSQTLPSYTKLTYETIHALFAGSYTEFVDVGNKGLEIAAKLIEHLIYLNQTQKAKFLLPWLLLYGQPEQWVRIGEMLAEKGDIQTAEDIFNRIKGQDQKQHYKERICSRLLLKDERQAAKHVLTWGGTDELGICGFLLWNRMYSNELSGFLKTGMRSKRLDAEFKAKLARLVELIDHEN